MLNPSHIFEISSNLLVTFPCLWLVAVECIISITFTYSRIPSFLHDDDDGRYFLSAHCVPSLLLSTLYVSLPPESNALPQMHVQILHDLTFSI